MILKIMASQRLEHSQATQSIRGYNGTIRLAVEVGDNNTKVLLESILKEEEDHIDWIEAQLDQIKQVGLRNYLGEQIY